MKKILIAGDSFAADWTVKYPGQGWPNMLADQYYVKNIAQAGVSQYKIYQQLESENLNEFDVVIIAHTSPFRIYVKQHPLHSKDRLHSNCDLIYTDLVASLPDHPELQSIVDYFEKYFDPSYAEFVHHLICEKIENQCEKNSTKVLHLINFKDQYQFSNSLNLYDVFEKHRGSMNHFNDTGNQIVYSRITEQLRNL